MCKILPFIILGFVMIITIAMASYNRYYINSQIVKSRDVVCKTGTLYTVDLHNKRAEIYTMMGSTAVCKSPPRGAR